MGIYISHLVSESFGNSRDHVVDDRSDGSQTSIAFSVSVVYLEGKFGLGDFSHDH